MAALSGARGDAVIRRRHWSLLIATTLIASCTERDRSVDYSVSAPVARAFSNDSTLVVYPAADADWRGLVDLRIFGVLTPGEAFEACVRRAGEPEERGRDRLGDYYGYRLPLGMVRVAHEESRSGLGGISKAWVLRALPNDMRPIEFFHPEVVRLLDEARAPISIVTVMRNRASNPAMHVEIRAGKVASVKWLPEVSIP